MLKHKFNYQLLGKSLHGRYQIIQVLSGGAFGQIYIAEEINHPERPKCIVKHYRPSSYYPSLLKTSKRIFVNEAENLKKLGSHQQIPRHLACFEGNQEFFLVQEYIEGDSLDICFPLSQHSDRSWNAGQVLEMLEDVLSVLEFIHTQGIIHCDLKPNNIIKRSSDGKYVLIDFGAAQSIREETNEAEIIDKQQLQSMVAVSHLGYIAPEQLVGKPYPNSDIYALGIIAIQALTGLDPAKLELNLETGEISWEHIYQKAGATFQLSEEFAQILTKMVSYDRHQRYQSAQEAIEALATVEVAATSVVGMPELGVVGETKSKARNVVVDAEAIFKPLQEELAQEVKKTAPAKKKPKVAAATPTNLGDLAENTIGLLESSFSNLSKLPPLLTGIGVGIAATNALAIGFGVNSLLNAVAADPGAESLWEAEQAFDRGNIEEAIRLAESISPESSAYEESQTAVKKWQQEWKLAEAQFKATETAFKEQRWLDAIAAGRKIPEIAFWQDRATPLVEQALAQAETEAKNLLQKAFTRAAKKDFTTALAYLKQIPPDTSVGAKVQQKLAEYQQKQEVRANYLLQQAFDRAAKRDFQGAINYLKQIPPDTPAGAIAKGKTLEYTQKQRIKAEVENNSTKPKTQTNASLSRSEINPGNELQEISAAIATR
ncbi:serine/threonine-protein kinase [Oscillatoria salina]|uniref:serine/threonine-protein kinase n=1 Tax=Oscillatoria salina TaxID=331517 RepID=UPI001CC902FB|nr:serine/threonine-protein kinase [Oscillatoria salina]